MGTPEFAVGILDGIIKSNYEVVGVITAADKPAGRGQQLKISAIKSYALSLGLPILQPTNLKDENFLESLKALNANLQIVVAFRMLPKQVWAMPSLGTFNLHASLLPQYRGAAPINWAIINGDQTTGVTTFFIDDKIDTGAIILQSELAILPLENLESLHDKLMNLGSQTVLNTLELIIHQNVCTLIQIENHQLLPAPKLTKENTKIDWNMTGNRIHNLVRGLSPYPAAWCFLNNNMENYTIKIFDTSFEKCQHEFEIGSIFTTKKTIKVMVSDGIVEILSLQLPGKKKMKSFELLNGYVFLDNAIVV